MNVKMKPTRRDDRNLWLRILYYGIPLALVVAIWVFESWRSGMLSLALIVLWFYLGGR